MHRKVLFWYAFTHTMNFLLLLVAVVNHEQLKQIALTFRRFKKKLLLVIHEVENWIPALFSPKKCS